MQERHREYRTYHPPEIINGKWYYFIEFASPVDRTRTHGPFDSERAAMTHQRELRREADRRGC